jgi:flagellar hook-basal body complex protein FliE
MSIESVGAATHLIKNHDGESWVRNNDLKVNKLFKFSDSPNGGKTNIDSNKTFGEFLNDSLLKVNDLQEKANHSIEKLATGKSKNVHETLLAVEKADIAFKAMNQIRLKVLDAYREVMRMQI